MNSPGAQLTTEQLIQACLNSDQQAWAEIVNRHWRPVFNVAYKFVGKHDEAEDLSQEIFFKVYKALETFNKEANFQTWLISISRNFCIDHYRSVRKEREVLDRNANLDELSLITKGPNPFINLSRSNQRDLLKRALLLIPDKLRTCIVMRDIRDLSYHEISTKLDLPVGTVKSRINRGRKELARQILELQQIQKVASLSL